MIIGTAGHIDHGKTSLIRALTGRDTDRLPEERRRGITIELGYAFMAHPGGGTLAFVDVPGHERFVHTMLAGATGVDAALLVIAADDGVMPQTREHLDILRLLDVRHGVIALTKIDAVDEARRVAVRSEISQWLDGRPESDWPVIAVSSRTGVGVDEVRDAVCTLATDLGERIEGGHFRLAVDRAFTLSGIGTVVTGTVHAGTVHEGDEVVVAPEGVRAKVRSIHAQDRPAPLARAGDRCALNLAGLGKDDVPRGSWVQGPALSNVATGFDATLRVSPQEARALTSSTSVHLHHGSRDVLARVGVLNAAAAAPGERVLVNIVPAAPLAVCRGDRFVLRDVSAQRTIAGGVVLDVDPPARYKRAPARLALLDALDGADLPAAMAACLSASPLRLARYAAAWNVEDSALSALALAAGARIAAGWAFSSGAWVALRSDCVVAVQSAHEREPEMPGLEQNRLRRMVGARLDPEAFALLIDELLADGSFARRGAFLALPEHKAELGAAERVRWEMLEPLIMAAPYGPPRVRDLARETGITESDARALLKKVARVGQVTLVAHDHFFRTVDVALLADIAADIARVDGVVRAAPFRDRIGGGRKVAIQILEFFDRVGYTRRIGDEHVLRRDNPWRAVADELVSKEE